MQEFNDCFKLFFNLGMHNNKWINIRVLAHKQYFMHEVLFRSFESN